MTHIDRYREQIMAELPLMYRPNSARKGILIVVHNQEDALLRCLDSIASNTEDYTLHIYDNGSDPSLALSVAKWEERMHISVTDYWRVPTNDGFIVPNNRLIKLCREPYVILLNSDTEVRRGWDLAMVNYLEDHPETAQVGYCGSRLDGEGRGGERVYGDADYICGWCFCIPRQTYEMYGLFDEENLEFAYGEDSDFSFRLRDAGRGVHALHLDLVAHEGNRTIVEVYRGRPDYLKGTFARNHEYIRKRWSQYLRISEGNYATSDQERDLL